MLGLARQLGTTWRTVWRSIEPLLKVLAADPTQGTTVHGHSLPIAPLFAVAVLSQWVVALLSEVYGPWGWVH